MKEKVKCLVMIEDKSKFVDGKKNNKNTFKTKVFFDVNFL